MTERPGPGDRDVAGSAGGVLGLHVPKPLPRVAAPVLRRTAAHSGRAWPSVGRRFMPRTEGVGTRGAGPSDLGPPGTGTRCRQLELSARASLPVLDMS